MHTCSTRCTFTRSRANNSHCRWKRRCIILESFIAPTARRQIVVRLYHKHNAYFRARALLLSLPRHRNEMSILFERPSTLRDDTAATVFAYSKEAACTHRATVLRIRCFPLSSQTLEASTRCAWNCRSLDGQFDKRRGKINTLYKIRDDYAIR